MDTPLVHDEEDTLFMRTPVLTLAAFAVITVGGGTYGLVTSAPTPRRLRSGHHGWMGARSFASATRDCSPESPERDRSSWRKSGSGSTTLRRMSLSCWNCRRGFGRVPDR